MIRGILTLGTVAVTLAACAAPSPVPSAATSSPVPATSPARDPSRDPSSEAPSPSATGAPTARPPAAQPPTLALELVTDRVSAPINVEAASAEWLLVNERAGRVIAVSVGDGSGEVVLDLTDRVGAAGSEQGLLGLALHPEWPDVARSFVHYTDLNGDTVVSEVAATASGAGAPPTFDAGSERVLLTADQPYPNHNGGQLAFGPDGYLYIGLGDGGAADDPHGHGQDTATVLGSILRIDPDASDDSTPYGIPPDNPFADGAGGDPSIFLYGLRNPWRFSFDRETGLLWIADVGQNAYEEIDRLDTAEDAGANLGWNVMEGSHCFSAPGCPTDGLTMPLAEYGRDRGCSVTGGYVYRGAAMADLLGWYVFGDFCTGTLFGVPSDATTDAGTLAPLDLLDTSLFISAFGEGPDGTLYVADLRGALYRIVAAP